MRLSRPLQVVAALSLLVGGVGSCTEPVAGPLVVLTLATPDTNTDVNAAQVTRFVDEVERLSQGTIRIDPVWDVTPEGTDDWDQVVARAVADGNYDLGLVPSRSWDVLGVRSLQALNTPFLITSTELVEGVLSSAQLRAELLSELDQAGVVGLDLYPEQLRRPFGYDQPLYGPADYQGQVIRAPRSATSEVMLRAFGAAKVVDDDIDAVKQRGMESSFAYSGTGYVTGNVVFFPKVVTLVADDDLRERLRSDQWAILTDAAAATRRWLFETQPTEEDAAADFCRQGGAIATASDSDLAALQRAAEPVAEELRQDLRTARLIDAIKALAGKQAEPETVEECPVEDTTAPAHDPAEALRQLDGVYRARVPAAVLRAAGVTDENVIRQNAGRFTWTLDGGTWTYDQRTPHYISDPRASGPYTYRAGRFKMWWDSATYTDARLEIDPDGTIHFVDVRESDPEEQNLGDGFYSVPWRRVGDLPD